MLLSCEKQGPEDVLREAHRTVTYVISSFEQVKQTDRSKRREDKGVIEFYGEPLCRTQI
jgi:hypothetical protein